MQNDYQVGFNLVAIFSHGKNSFFKIPLQNNLRIISNQHREK